MAQQERRRKATHVNPELHERLRVLAFHRRVDIQRMVDAAVGSWLDEAEKAGERWWLNRFPDPKPADG